MVKKFGIVLACLFLTACMPSFDTHEKIESLSEPAEVITRKRSNDLTNLPPLDGPKIPIALYRFPDLTGQRKPSQNFARVWIF